MCRGRLRESILELNCAGRGDEVHPFICQPPRCCGIDLHEVCGNLGLLGMKTKVAGYPVVRRHPRAEG